MSHLPLSLGIAGWTAGASTILGLFALFGPGAPEQPFVMVMSGLAWLSLALEIACATTLVRSTLEEARAETGREPALRLCVPPGSLRLHDEFRGDFEVDVDAEVGDFPIRTRSGAPAYQLAVVIDDARMGVEEVVRGDDLLSSAARQYLLQQALGLPHPRWWHVPLVCDEHGQRLAKRTDALSLRELARRGVTRAEALQWVARVSGQVLDAELCCPDFDMRRVPREPVLCRSTDWPASR